MNYAIIYGIIAVAIVFGAVMYFIGCANGYNKCLDEKCGRKKNRTREDVKFIDENGRRFVDRRNKPRHRARKFDKQVKRPTKW